MNYSKEAQFDSQGEYFFATCKLAGWDEKRVEHFLIKKYQKTHWNVLTAKEKKQMIAMMNKYAKPERDKRKLTAEKGVRQSIMAIWRGTGHESEELHALMTEWGFGNSLRACKISILYEIQDRVKKICQPVNYKSKK